MSQTIHVTDAKYSTMLKSVSKAAAAPFRTRRLPRSWQMLASDPTGRLHCSSHAAALLAAVGARTPKTRPPPSDCLAENDP